MMMMIMTTMVVVVTGSAIVVHQRTRACLNVPYTRFGEVQEVSLGKGKGKADDK